VCLAQQNREALLRIPPLLATRDAEVATQLRLEYRGADAAANPYLALGAIVRAGLDGVRGELPAPPLLDRDPALLGEAEASRYGVGGLPGSLQDALQALADDETVRGWLSPQLYDAYVGVKHAEIDAAAELNLDELCVRYAAIY
jgi:glutamine synthetase